MTNYEYILDNLDQLTDKQLDAILTVLTNQSPNS